MFFRRLLRLTVHKGNRESKPHPVKKKNKEEENCDEFLRKTKEGSPRPLKKITTRKKNATDFYYNGTYERNTLLSKLVRSFLFARFV